MLLRFGFIFSLIISYQLTQLKAQTSDPTLFSIDKVNIPLSEFEYIYKKTNGDKADFSEASIKEYLDLYVKFKLKVKKARDMQLDTIPALQQELAGYRKQLANTYLIDKQVTGQLAKEAYERSKQDVSISHILVKVPATVTDKTEKKALDKINNIHRQLTNGGTFESIAQKQSNDKRSAKNGGKIGYITALQLSGFYEIETTAYNTPVGKFSQPIRSRIGYHIIKVNDIREARGEIDASHILIRTDKKHSNNEAKDLINKIHEELTNGVFETLARKYSEDEASAGKGGRLGFFGIGNYKQDFEEQAFAIKKAGSYSKPFKTEYGWHIVKLNAKKPRKEYERARNEFQNKVKRDSRFDKEQAILVESIKKEANFKERISAKNQLLQQLDKSFLTYRWKAPKDIKNQELFSLGNTTNNLVDFVLFLEKQVQIRIQNKNANIKTVYNQLYNGFVSERALAYEETQLEKKYPDFKALMREYQEGILLFEATKRLVWDKASQDSIGLQAFYQDNTSKYQWAERAKLNTYICNCTESVAMKAKKRAKKCKKSEKVLLKFNKKSKILSVHDFTIEKEQIEKDNQKGLMWKKGSVSELQKQGDNAFAFTKIEAILPPAKKSLQEARGYVVADYQDYLEKRWIEKLQKAYPVTINDKVLNNLIKK